MSNAVNMWRVWWEREAVRTDVPCQDGCLEAQTLRPRTEEGRAFTFSLWDVSQHLETF